MSSDVQVPVSASLQKENLDEKGDKKKKLLEAGALSNTNRRSSREKKSTLIYIDGYAVKKDNNYVVKGCEYVYGDAGGGDKRVPPERNKQKNQTKPKARVVSNLEQERRDKKLQIERTIQQKAAIRNHFLHQHAPLLAPFVDPKLLETIQKSQAGTASAKMIQTQTQATSEIYMQPDSITADMRDYQLEGLNWMSKMHSRNVGMILGDGTSLDGAERSGLKLSRGNFDSSHL